MEGSMPRNCAGDGANQPVQHDAETALANVRAERVHLQHESQMLRMALEELDEAEEASEAEESAMLRKIASREDELLRCLVCYAMQRGRLGSEPEAAAISDIETTKMSALRKVEERLLDVMDSYREAQNAITNDLQRELDACRNQLDDTHSAASRSPVKPLCGNSEKNKGAVNETDSGATACEVELLREMTAEANIAIDAMLLEYGAAVFT